MLGIHIGVSALVDIDLYVDLVTRGLPEFSGKEDECSQRFISIQYHIDDLFSAPKG